MTQGIVMAVIGGEEFADTPMQGQMVTADFEKDEITLRMTGRYYAQHGTFMLIPFEEWEKIKERTAAHDESKEGK